MGCKNRVLETYAELPLSFEANQGQAGKAIDFLARGPGYRVFLQQAGAVVALNNGKTGTMILRMAIAGGHPEARAEGVDRLPGITNYLIGRDPKGWRTDLSSYAKVRYRQVYPGVDLVYYGHQQRLEYDFVVSPGADPGMIKLHFSGMAKISVEKDGRLNLVSAAGESVFFSAPTVYQEIEGVRRHVDGRYVLGTKTGQVGTCSEVGFAIGEYDRTRPLVIDPILTYAVFLGGPHWDEIYDIAVDHDHGNAFVTGRADGVLDFAGKEIGGTAGFMNSVNVFVVKLSVDGDMILYTTYVGGLGEEAGTCIALDDQRNAYVGGYTDSADFPVNGTVTSFSGERDGFVFKLNPDGNAIAHATYVGGTGDDEVMDVAVDHAFIAIAGRTGSSDFPHDEQPSGKIGAFVATLSPATGLFAHVRVLGGGAAHAIAFDGAGDLYIGGMTSEHSFPATLDAFQSAKNIGQDGFVAKLDPIGLATIYCSFLGGDNYDGVNGIAVNPDGHVFATGYTYSTDFPVTAGAYQTTLVITPEYRMDAFVTRFNADGSDLVFSTYIGGGGRDEGHDIALDQCDNVFVAGGTSDNQTHLPQVNPLPGSGVSGEDAFVLKLNALGTGLLFSSCLGGGSLESAYAIGLDTFGNVYVAGSSFSRDFLGVSMTYGGMDGFIACVSTSPQRIGFSDLAFTVDEDAGAAVVNVSRYGSGSGMVTVDYLTRDGNAVMGVGTAVADEDYTAVSGTLAWHDGDLADKVITIPILDDALEEPVEGVDLFLVNPAGDAEIGCAAVATLAIADDEQPAPPCIVEFLQAGYTVTEADTFAEIAVVRSGDDSGAVTVEYRTDNGSATSGDDYTPASGVLEWAAGETGVKQFSIAILDDHLSEGDETVNLALEGPCSPAEALIAAVLTIQDDEREENGILQFETQAYSVDEDAGIIEITVVRQSGSIGQVTVEFATVQNTAGGAEFGKDYVIARGVLTFLEGEMEATITLEIVDDTVVESDESFDVVLSNPTGGAVLGTNAVTTVSIQDDQVAHGGRRTRSCNNPCAMSDPNGGMRFEHVFFMCLFLGALALWWRIRRRSAGIE